MPHTAAPHRIQAVKRRTPESQCLGLQITHLISPAEVSLKVKATGCYGRFKSVTRHLLHTKEDRYMTVTAAQVGRSSWGAGCCFLGTWGARQCATAGRAVDSRKGRRRCLDMAAEKVQPRRGCGFLARRGGPRVSCVGSHALQHVRGRGSHPLPARIGGDHDIVLASRLKERTHNTVERKARTARSHAG
jgi:hypothetical protein